MSTARAPHPPEGSRPGSPTRRHLLTALMTGTGLTMTSSLAPPAPRPAECAINLGFEDLQADRERWRLLGPALAASGADAVSLAVGRVDWTGFQWDTHPDAASGTVRSTGRDLVAEVIGRVNHLLGRKPALTLTIDALAPRLLAERPGLAGTAPDGTRSSEFASVRALEDGEVGERLVGLAAEIAEKYRPGRIALTELMFDESTFGLEDLDSYRFWTGASSWPLQEDGGIDTAHPSLGRWRSGVLAGLLARIRKAVRPWGVELEVDVRAPHRSPHADRPLSGHDYKALLTSADRLAVWNYPGIDGQGTEFAGALSRSLEQRFPRRVTISTGLWARRGLLTPATLATTLEELARAGAPSVSVTPASLLTTEHWQVVRGAWAR